MQKPEQERNAIHTRSGHDPSQAEIWGAQARLDHKNTWLELGSFTLDQNSSRAFIEPDIEISRATQFVENTTGT